MTTKIETTARLLLGLVVILFGLNGFFQFMPQPSLPEPATDFLGAILATGYLLAIVKILEIGIGVLLLANRYVPLALVLLAPISVNIISFHLFLDPAGIGAAALVTALNLYLLFAYRRHYKSLLNAKTEVSPTTLSA